MTSVEQLRLGQQAFLTLRTRFATLRDVLSTMEDPPDVAAINQSLLFILRIFELAWRDGTLELPVPKLGICADGTIDAQWGNRRSAYLLLNIGKEEASFYGDVPDGLIVCNGYPATPSGVLQALLQLGLATMTSAFGSTIEFSL